MGTQGIREQRYSLVFAFTIARNIVTDKIRRYYKQEDFVAYIYNRMEDTSRNTTEDTIHFRELKKMHDQVMEALPVKRRQIYELSFNHELSLSCHCRKAVLISPYSRMSIITGS